MHSSFISTPGERVQDLMEVFGSPAASAAYLLCDRYDPDRVAYHVIDGDLNDKLLTYGEMRQASERVAAGLAAMGIGEGDRVATLMGKSRDYLVALVAIWRLGAVHVPLFTAFASPEIALRLDASVSKIVICDAAQRTKLDSETASGWLIVTTGAPQEGDVEFATLLACSAPVPAAAAIGGDGALIQIFTSGTTGRPKGVAVPLRALASFQIYAEYGLGLRKGDRYWNAADPGWAYGLYFGVLASLVTGTESFLFTGGFSPAATAKILETYEISNLAAAPTVYRSLEHAGVEFGTLSLRCASSAGEPLTPEVNEWAARALGVEVRDHYGQTEAGMMINNHHHPELKTLLRPGSMGTAMPGWTADILQENSDTPAAPGEVGRVAIDISASPLFWFDGYLGEPEKSAQKFSADGRWYLTGDVGRRDEDGFFYFASRDDDVIIMAGYRIGPVEIESVLLRHPAVSECAAVAVADDVRGEVLEAAVVLAPDFLASDELSAELQTKVKREFAAHAYPRKIHYFSSIPKTASGKLQRYLVRQTLAEQAKLSV